MPYKKLDNLLQKYSSGESVRKLAEEYNCGYETMRGLISGLGAIDIITKDMKDDRKKIITPKMLHDRRQKLKGKRKFAIDREQLKTDYIYKNLTAREIANKYNVSVSCVRSTLNEYGIRKMKEKSEYPKNVLEDIFDTSNYEQLIKTDYNLCVEGLEFCISSLSEREKIIICERYKDGISLRDIGNMHGITGTRARDIIRKSLRRIRSKQGYIIYGIDGFEKIKRKEKEEKNLNKTDIVNIELSVRTYNCLARAGIEKLEDIKSMEQLMEMRNAGAKTIEEIVEKLKEYGIEIK